MEANSVLLDLGEVIYLPFNVYTSDDQTLSIFFRSETVLYRRHTYYSS